MTRQFVEVTYLAQVRRLSKFAEAALAHFPIRAREIHFLNHAENTTFRVTARDGRKYLLRVHRNDYHTKPAIQEELRWLSHLSKKGLAVPAPVKSKKGELVETVTHASIPQPRNCSMFKWNEGKFLEKSLTPKHMFEVGRLIAEFHNHTPRAFSKHRHYWNAEGLVGAVPRFGAIDSLEGVKPSHQRIITTGRKFIYSKLRAFQKKHPQRMGLIHADMHFGNILFNGSLPRAIDFDDCGVGFHAYDLVTPMISAEANLNKDLPPDFYDGMVEGYKTLRKWDADDDKIFPYLHTARRVIMLGWINSRRDNPQIYKLLPSRVERMLKILKTKHGIG